MSILVLLFLFMLSHCRSLGNWEKAAKICHFVLYYPRMESSDMDESRNIFVNVSDQIVSRRLFLEVLSSL